MSHKNRVVFYLSDHEYNLLSKKAAACNISVNSFAKQKVLDETDAITLRKSAAFVMAELYRWSEMTADLNARDYFRRGGDLLCQSLK